MNDTKTTVKKTGLILIEITLVVAIIVAICVSVLAYRLKQAPLDISFAAPMIADGLTNAETGVATKFEKVALHWPVFKGPLLIVLDNMQVEQDEKTVLDLQTAAISLDYPSLLIGKIKPKAVILQKPTLRIIRTTDNKVKITASGTKQAPLDKGNIAFDEILQSSLQMSGSDTQKDPLYGLTAIDIDNASVFVEDHAQRKTWQIPSLDLRLLRQEGQIDFYTAIAVQDDEKKMRFETIVTGEKNGGYDIATQYRDVNPALIAEILGLGNIQQNELSLNGMLSVQVSDNFALQKFDATSSLQDGRFKMEGYPFTLTDFSLNFVLDKQNKIFALKELQAKAGDVVVSAEGEGRIEGNRINFPLFVNIQDVPLDSIDPIWPETDEGNAAPRDWVVEKLSVGMLKNFEAQIPFDIILPEDAETPEIALNRWDVDVDDVEMNFALENATLDYRAPLAPVTNMNAKGVYKDGNLRIDTTSGRVGGLTVDKGTTLLTDIRVKGGGVANIDIHATGGLASALQYIREEPIAIKDLSFDTKNATGDVDLNVAINFPTVKGLKAEQVKVKVNADLNNAKLTNTVKGMVLTGGPFKLNAEGGKITLAGKGQIGGTPLTLKFEEYIDPKGAPFLQRVDAKLTANRALRAKFGVTLDDYLAGDLPLDILYTSKFNKTATIDAKANLTPVQFRIDPLDYKKEKAQAGSATAKIILTNNDIKEVQNLDIKLPEGSITGGRLGFGKIKGVTDVTKGTFASVKLPENNFGLSFVRDEKGAFVFNVSGKRLDARPFLDSDKKDREIQVSDKAQDEDAPVVVSGDVAYLKLSDEGGIRNANVFADVSKRGIINKLEVNSTVGNGSMELRYRINPKTKRLRFQLDAKDAGEMLKSLGLYQNMIGGRLYIDGNAVPNGHPNDLDGRIQVENFRIKNAPGMAKLVNALSIDGIQELLNNQGMSFSRMETKFKYLNTSEGTVITFSDGRTSGSEVGLTFEGTVNKSKDNLDIQGTIAPLATLNSFVGKIPLVGQILTGGDALFAATYKMQGPSKDADVKINPLSALAPGIIRKILFEGENPAKEVKK